MHSLPAKPRAVCGASNLLKTLSMEHGKLEMLPQGVHRTEDKDSSGEPRSPGWHLFEHPQSLHSMLSGTRLAILGEDTGHLQKVPEQHLSIADWPALETAQGHRRFPGPPEGYDQHLHKLCGWNKWEKGDFWGSPRGERDITHLPWVEATCSTCWEYEHVDELNQNAGSFPGLFC